MAQVASRGLFGRWQVDTADKLHLHPVMMIGIHVAQQHRRSVDGIDDHIDFAVVEQVAEGRAARGDHDCQPGALHRRDVLEFPVLRSVGHVVKQQRPLRTGRAPVVLIHLRIDVAVHFKQIEPAVIVVVEEPIAPADKGNRGLRNARLVTHVGEARVAVVVEQDFVVVAEVGDIRNRRGRCSRSRLRQCPSMRSRAHLC